MAVAKKNPAANDSFDSLRFKPDALQEGFARATHGWSTLADLQKSSIEALVASAGVLSKSAEKTALEHAAFLTAEYEAALVASGAAAASRSIHEAFDVQSEYARSAFERTLGQFNKLTDFWSSAAKDAAEPLTTRYGEFVEIVQSYRP